MKVPRGRFLHLAAGAAAISVISASMILLSGQGAWSETPRTIKIVVPVPPGGGMDFLVRLLADQIGRTQGLTILVESRPGAGGMIATEAVSRAAPDGATLLIQSPSFVIDPHLRKLSYDPLTSFEPVCDLVAAPNVIVVNSASPYRTLADLVIAARSKPGDLTIASIGPASNQHMAIEMLKRMANIDLTYAPYSGSAPTVNALLGEHVTSLMAAYANLAEQSEAGKLRALGRPDRWYCRWRAGSRRAEAQAPYSQPVPGDRGERRRRRSCTCHRPTESGGNLDIPQHRHRSLPAVGHCGARYRHRP